MVRSVLNRMLDTEAFGQHLQSHIERHNKQYGTELHLNVREVKAIKLLMEGKLKRSYGTLGDTELALKYQLLIQDISYFLFALIGELFPTSIRGNYSDARYHAMVDYIFRMTEECLGNRITVGAHVPTETKHKIGQKYHADPIAALNILSDFKIDVNAWRALGDRRR